jgi:hypothetical protein
MRSDTRRRLDSLVWKRRALVSLGIALGLVALGALFTYGYWPDPVVETRIVSGVVTDWTRKQTKYREKDAIAVSVSLDNGRNIIITQWAPDVLVGGSADIEERQHNSGRKSYLWLRSKSD